MSSWVPKNLHLAAIVLIVLGYVLFFASIDTIVVETHLVSWTVAYGVSGLVFILVTSVFAVLHAQKANAAQASGLL